MEGDRPKYIIIGGRKCGSTSLEKYLKEKKFDVIRVEQLFTRKDGRAEYDEKYSDRIPWLILRHPIRRIWSDYNYMNVKTHRFAMKPEEYFKMENYQKEPFNYGDLNPISQSNYAKWYVNWEDLKINVTWLEDIQVSFDFPHETKGEYEEISEDVAEMAIQCLKTQEKWDETSLAYSEMLAMIATSKEIKDFYTKFVELVLYG